MLAKRWVAAFLTMVAACSPAWSAAGADLTLTGDGVDVHVAVAEAGANFDFGSFDLALAPGQTVTETFDYSIHLDDDGLAASRQWQFCTPIFETDCGPLATGREQAYASIWMGRDPRSSTGDDYMISDGPVFESFHSITGDPTTFTGTIAYTATNTSTFMSQSATVSIMAADFVDASAVPEPPAAAMLALALGLLAAPRARRPGALRPRARATAASRR